MISSASVLATWRSASRSVWTYCFMVNAKSEWPMRWLSAFQSILASNCGGVAVPDVVQVDLGQARGRGELLEPPRDRVRMRRPAVLPAEQHPVILVVRAELAPFVVEPFDVCLQRGQRERVKRRRCAAPDRRSPAPGSALARPARRARAVSPSNVTDLGGSIIGLGGISVL